VQILFQVLAVRPFAGVGKSGRPYSFVIVEGQVALEGQQRICEVSVDKADGIEPGRAYEVSFRPSIGQDKRLAMRVDKFTPAVAKPAARAA